MAAARLQLVDFAVNKWPVMLIVTVLHYLPITLRGVVYDPYLLTIRRL